MDLFRNLSKLSHIIRSIVMKKLNIGITLLASLFWFSCSGEEVAEPAVIPEQPEEVASLLQQYNTDVAALQLMAEGGAKVTSYTEMVRLVIK